MSSAQTGRAGADGGGVRMPGSLQERQRRRLGAASPTPVGGRPVPVADFLVDAQRLPSSQRVLGSGASIAGGGFGSVGLQMSRASGPLDIARAAAAEDGTYSGNWQVTAYAVCVNPVGAAAEGSVQTGVSSASHSCPGAEQVHSAGGATGPGTTGQTFLNSLYPDAGLTSVRLSLTGVPSDGLAIQAICA
ncbi:hypothetical protein [Micromonospora sp. LOL_024]|uniref:hypothetical protein n=1 Tax=Micromonospora sp. LOL_024 TaxID=3345412 RepID=UPI003A8BB3C1